MKGAIEALKFASENSPNFRFEIIRRLRGELTRGLDGMGVEMLTPPPESNLGGGIVTFKEKQREVVSRLMKRNIVTSGRFGYVRVSPHFYNTGEEIEKFLKALREIRKDRN